VSVVQDLMASLGHHLPEFDYLLGIGTGVVFFRCNCMRNRKAMKSHSQEYMVSLSLSSGILSLTIKLESINVILFVGWMVSLPLSSLIK